MAATAAATASCSFLMAPVYNTPRCQLLTLEHSFLGSPPRLVARFGVYKAQVQIPTNAVQPLRLRAGLALP